MNRIPPQRLKTFLGGVLVVILPFLQRLLYLKGLFYGRDFTELIGARGYFYHQLRQGKLVLWDGLQATGIPFASYLFDLFNPLSLVYTFLLEDGYLRSNPAQWILTIHCSLGALGAYLLGLSLNLGRTAAVVMGVIMGCCGVVVIKSVEPMMVHTFAWAPFIFLFLLRARRRKLKREGLWAGVFMGLCFLGGHPQIFYYIGLAVLLYALYGMVMDAEASGGKAAWAAAFRIYLPLALSFVLTCAPQLAQQLVTLVWGPADVLSANSTRTLLIHSQTGSADFSMLYTFLFPQLEGGHGETFFYVGIMPLVLAWVAVLRFQPHSEAGFWKVLVIAFLLLMMGGTLGIHKILVYVVPAFKYFRFPSRYSFLVHLGLLVLAGFGVARLLSVNKAGELAGFTRGLAVIIAGLLLVMISLVVVSHLKILPDKDQIANILHSVTGVILFLAATWFVFRRVDEGETGLRLRFLIVAVVVLDLAFYYPAVGINFNIVTTQKDFGPDPSEVTGSMEVMARDLGRFSAEGPARILIGLQGVRTPWERDISQSAFYRYQVRSFYPIDGYPERLHPLGYWQLAWRDKLIGMPRAIDLLGVKYLEDGLPEISARRSRWDLLRFSQAAIRLKPGEKVSQLALEARVDGLEGKAPGLAVAEIGLAEGHHLKGSWPLTVEQLSKGGPLEIPLAEPLTASEILMASTNPEVTVRIEKVSINGNPVSDTLETNPVRSWLVRNEHPQPPAFFVSRAAVFKEQHAYLEALYSEDPTRCVLFRETPPGYQAPAKMTADPGGEVKIIEWKDEEVRLQVDARRSGYLVMTQTAYPGWTAWVDGRKISILKAYGFLTALPIGPGVHQVRFAYSAPWLVAGLIISPLWLSGLLFWTLRRKKEEHYERNSGETA
jgi:hypothetical protein